MKKVFLAGYENITLEEFIKKIKSNGVTTLVDVRELPLSRKKGFSKSQLSSALSESGLKYEHIGNLGSPRKIRHELRDKEGNYITFFNKYRAYVKNKHFELQRIASMTKTEVICIMCFEESCELCHRAIVADEIIKISPNITVQAI